MPNDMPTGSYVVPTPAQLAAATDWVRRFEERWLNPDADSLRDLMHEDTRNLIPPMKVPGDREAVVEHFRTVLARMRNFKLRIIRWAPVSDSLLLEWEGTAVVAGKALSWRGVDRVSLRDGKTYEGQVYWDTRGVAEMIAEAVQSQG
jgi:ketosteroid isomerase-like protein